MNENNAIGIMSGSSLDGLDLCYAKFQKRTSSWDFEIQAHSTYSFNATLFEKLKTARTNNEENEKISKQRDRSKRILSNSKKIESARKSYHQPETNRKNKLIYV